MDSIVFPALPTYLFESSLAGVLSLVLTVILPILAAVLMRSSWSAFQKGLVLLAMSAVKAFIEAWIGAATSGEVWLWADTLYAVVINFVLAVVAYVGLLRNTSIQQSALATGVTDNPRPAG